MYTISQNEVAPYWAVNFHTKPSDEQIAGARKFIEGATEKWTKARAAHDRDSIEISLFAKV